MIAKTHQLSESVRASRSLPLDWADKAVQPSWYGLSTVDVAAAAPTLDDLSTPMMTLDRGAMDYNLTTMTAWCNDFTLSLAPHGKTTMSPALWLNQLDAGAWAITVANEPQLRVARGAGVPRVIVANLFLRSAGLEWLAGELSDDPDFEFLCWVDSVEAVRRMDEGLSSLVEGRKIGVLVELGRDHARTGARTLADALDVATAISVADHLALAGVAGYEGAVAHGTDAAALATVDEFLGEMLTLHESLRDKYEVETPILTAGGSAYFDRVAAILSPEAARGTRIVLRSGAFVVHDDGYYRDATPSARGTGPQFRSAMNAWARVISMPEPGVAFLDAGKRDVPYDEGLPEIQSLRRIEWDGSVSTVPLSDHEIFATNDQHSYVRLPADSPLRIGDVVRLGLSHPCTAFDKWALIPVLDDASAAIPTVVDLVRTYF
jgi:D-serine deaminase-like pyridoxal phosphate-dependent protein